MNILELKNVSKSFPRTDIDDITVALSDISLTVKDGEFVSLVGPSGCGKSTILRLIAGLIPPTMGELILNGKQIEGPAPNRGMVFQQPTLFPWLTVKQNASFSPKILKTYKQKEKRLEQLIETVGLTEFSDSYPGWQPIYETEILALAQKIYTEQFRQDAKIKVIHAGLECGLLKKNYPNVEMISIGPTIRDAHSPDEKVNIASVQAYWHFLTEILAKIPPKLTAL